MFFWFEQSVDLFSRGWGSGVCVCVCVCVWGGGGGGGGGGGRYGHGTNSTLRQNRATLSAINVKFNASRFVLEGVNGKN